MFRDLYKQANDEIRGDRAILDRAFLQATQPEKKKSPVIKYSFIGTAVAAVIVLGAVFANPSVFTNRSEDLKTPVEITAPTEAAEVVSAPVVTFVTETADDTPVVNSEVEVPSKQKAATTVSPDGNEAAVNDTPQNEDEPEAEAEEYGIAIMSLGDEDGGVYEVATEEAVAFVWGRGRMTEDSEEEDAIQWTDATEAEAVTETETVTESEEVTAETASELEKGEAVEMFSYMYDMSIYEAGEPGVKTEGFVNTDIRAVTNSAEAVERAKTECTVEYDTTAVYRDPIENMWKVMFYMEGMEGGNQAVYMDSNGVTQLIIYGE